MLGVDLRRHVFLIFKESVTNIVRHSGADRAEILLHVDRTALRLTVTDNGRGRRAFADGNVASVQGHGLAGMRARARELRGVLTIDVPPEGGLVVSLAVPLRRPPLELAVRWLRRRDVARRAGSA
jgi:signal transduction histidine kinase